MLFLGGLNVHDLHSFQFHVFLFVCICFLFIYWVCDVTISRGLYGLYLGWGFPPHVCTCSTPVNDTAFPTTAGSRQLYSSPFTARHKQYSLCLCRCNDKAVAMVAALWCWETEMMNCKCERWSKSGRIPRAHHGGGLEDFMMCEFI